MVVVVVVFLRYFDFVGWARGRASGSSYPNDSCLADQEQCEVAPVHWSVKEKTKTVAKAVVLISGVFSCCCCRQLY